MAADQGLPGPKGDVAAAAAEQQGSEQGKERAVARYLTTNEHRGQAGSPFSGLNQRALQK